MKYISEKPKKIKIVEVVEITEDIEDDSVLMPKRTIKEFWTLDNRYIGKIDPLNDYLAIEETVKSSASSDTNSKEIK